MAAQLSHPMSHCQTLYHICSSAIRSGRIEMAMSSEQSLGCTKLHALSNNVLPTPYGVLYLDLFPILSRKPTRRAP